MSGGGFLKKAICLLLSVVLVVCPVLSVSAATGEEVMESFQGADAATIIKYLFSQMGAVFAGSLDDVIQNNETLVEYYNNGLPAYKDDKGNIRISNEVTNNVYNAVKSNLTALNGYYLVEPERSVADFFFSMREGLELFALDNWRRDFKKYTPEGLTLSYQEGSSFARLPRSPVVGCFISGDKVVGYSTSKGVVSFGLSSYSSSYGNTWGTPSGGYVSYEATVDDFKNHLICDAPVKLFYTQQDLLYYVNFGGKVYTTNKFNNYSPSDVTYKSNVVNNTNWNEVNQNIYNNIMNNYGSTPDSDRQDMIDGKYDEIISELGDIGGSVDDVNATMNSWLKKIYTKVDAILAVVQNPTKILDLIGAKADMIGTKIQGVIDAVKDMDASGGGGLGNVIGSALGTLLGNLLDKIIGGGEEAVTDAVQELATTFAPMIDVSKTRFPFSIPWDFGAVILLFAAKPEIPKFEIPFKLYDSEQMISIDLTPFERMSDLSRTMFTILFVVALMSFTIRLIGKGGD